MTRVNQSVTHQPGGEGAGLFTTIRFLARPQIQWPRRSRNQQRTQDADDAADRAPATRPDTAQAAPKLQSPDTRRVGSVGFDTVRLYGPHP